jgi:hypothetical protein
MFEIGSYYRFKIWIPGKDGGEIAEYVPCKIVSAEAPLVKIQDSRGGASVIINTASIAFVSATEAE